MRVFILFLFIVAMSACPAVATVESVSSDSGAEAATTDQQYSDEAQTELEVTGVVTKVSADADGYPLKVKVQSHIISEYGLGNALFDLVGQKVRITGEVFTDDQGQVFDVISYEVLEEGGAN